MQDERDALGRGHRVEHDQEGHADRLIQGDPVRWVGRGAAAGPLGGTRRDTHLRSADFFDIDSNPDITFTADGIRPSSQGVTVTGALTVRGRTRPLSFDAAASVQGDGGIWLDAEVRINRADFGLTWNPLGIVGVSNSLTIQAVFTRR